MKGKILLEFTLSKQDEKHYFGKYTEKQVLESMAKYLITVTPSAAGSLRLLSTETLEKLKDRHSKKEKKIEKKVEIIEKERQKKNKERVKKIKQAKRKKK